MYYFLLPTCWVCFPLLCLTEREKRKKRERDDHFISKVIRHLKYEIKRFPKKTFFVIKIVGISNPILIKIQQRFNKCFLCSICSTACYCFHHYGLIR